MLLANSTTTPLLSSLTFTPSRGDGTLIISLPSSLEREFSRMPYSKGLSLLLKKTKIDYCLMFVVNKQKLKKLIEEVHEHLKDDCVFWIAFPKHTSKIMTNLRLNGDWSFMEKLHFNKYKYVVMDTVWSSICFKKFTPQQLKNIQAEQNKIDISQYIDEEQEDIKNLHPSLNLAFGKYDLTYNFFKALSFEQKKSYIAWIHTVSKDIVLQKRILDAVAKMNAGVLNPYFFEATE